MSSYIRPKIFNSRKFVDDNVIYANMKTVLINNIHYPVCLGYSNKNGSNSKVFIIAAHSGDFKKEFLTILTRFLFANKNSIIYFHNLTKFNGYFLLKNFYYIFPSESIHFIERNHKIYKIFLKNINIQIKDSYLLLPESSKQISISFNRFYKSSDFVCSNWYVKPFKLKKNLINSILNSQEGFSCYTNSLNTTFSINAHTYLSLTSLSFNIFLNKYYVKELIYKNSLKVDNYLRDGYVGGVCDLYSPLLKYGYFYDINSLYPSMMCKDMPVKTRHYCKNSQIRLINFFGFIEVIVTSPENLNIPILTSKSKIKGTLNPLGTWKGIYFSEELKSAQSLGYRIKIVRGIKYVRGKIFLQYIKFLYQIRLTHEQNLQLKSITKLLLNSFYGKLGMKTILNQKNVLSSESIKNLKEDYTLSSVTFLVNSYRMVSYSLKPTLKNFKQMFAQSLSSDSAVHVSAATTSYARLAIYRFKIIPSNQCFYSDTDSVFLKKRLSSYSVAHSLGFMKQVQYLHYAYFISIKCFLYSNFKKEKKIKFKGLPIKERKILTNKYFYEHLLKKNSIGISYYRSDLYHTRSSSLNIFSKKLFINLRMPFNKRVKVYVNNKWWSTRPIIVSDID